MHQLDKLTNKGDKQSNFHSSFRGGPLEGMDSPNVAPERINNVTSDLLITPQYLVNAPLHMNLHGDNLSDKTLKTILNLQSDRAQTQQQKRVPLQKAVHESSKNCQMGHNHFIVGDLHVSHHQSQIGGSKDEAE